MVPEKTAPGSATMSAPLNSAPMTIVPLWTWNSPPFRAAPVMIDAESANTVPPKSERSLTAVLSNVARPPLTVIVPTVAEVAARDPPFIVV